MWWINVISEYQELYPGDKVCVIGGAAIYLWIKKILNIETNVNDLDLSIISSKPNEVANRWIKLLSKHGIEAYVDKIDQPIIYIKFNTSVPSNEPKSIDLFVNDIEQPSCVKIDNLSVEKFTSLYRDTKHIIPELEVDLSYPKLNDIDKEYISSKLVRKQNQLILLEKVKEKILELQNKKVTTYTC